MVCMVTGQRSIHRAVSAFGSFTYLPCGFGSGRAGAAWIGFHISPLT